jgi:hypothetical protein
MNVTVLRWKDLIGFPVGNDSARNQAIRSVASTEVGVMIV